MFSAFLLAGLVTFAAGADRDADQAAVAQVLARQHARVALIERIAPSTACVFQTGSQAGGGSGVIIDEEGYGLTNFHVVAGMLRERKGEIGLSDGMLRPMEVLGIDPGGDVAMFKVDRSDVSGWAALGDSGTLRVGDEVLALGNPFGLSDDYTPTVTLGIVSGLNRYQAGVRGALVYTGCIQVDASINPGNSGGPLFDLNGRVVGINGRISLEERSRVNVGVGFAITVDQIRRFIPMLRAGLTTPHATAAFTVADSPDGHVVVDRLDENRPAHRAGLRRGDRLVRMAGSEIDSANGFLSLVGTYPAGWPVEVIYERGGEVRRFTMRLDALPLPQLGPEGARRREGAFDPYAPHAVTTKAHRRAVRRALAMLHKATGIESGAVGGAGAVTAKGPVTVEGRRRLAASPEEEPQPLTWELDFDAGAGDLVDLSAAPDEVERRIVSALLSAGERPDRRGYRVVASDEVGGRVAVVLERRQENGGAYRVSLDDETGRLRAVEFRHEKVGVTIRYEYSDDRPVGPLKLPHVRRLFRDDAPYAEDRFGSAEDTSPIEKTSPPASGVAQDDPARIVGAEASVVKLYGKAAGREHGYGTGVLVSPDGRIVTSLSLFVTLRGLRAVLADGRVFDARLERADERRQLALLKLDAPGAAPLSFMTPADDASIEAGDSVWALGNWFKIADGKEPVSVCRGTFSMRTPLAARRLAQDFDYEGDVLVYDAITANPGAAGGPLLDVGGRFVGLVCKTIEAVNTNTRINCAIPAAEVAAFLAESDVPGDVRAAGGSREASEGASKSGPSSVTSGGNAGKKPYLGIRLARLGYRHVSAYVERVRPESPADAAGIREDDLILSVDARRVSDAASYEAAVARLLPGQVIKLTVKRGAEIIIVELTVGAEP